jgi:hypothetical protein
MSRSLALNSRGPTVQRKCACGRAGPGDDSIHRALVQPALSISSPGDRFELEADRVADHVMRMAAPEHGDGPSLSKLTEYLSVGRVCASCAAAADRDLTSVVARATNGGGEALDRNPR